MTETTVVDLQETISELMANVDEVEKEMRITLDHLGIDPCAGQSKADVTWPERTIERTIVRVQDVNTHLRLLVAWVNQINEALDLL